jgi:hypothetical protein
MLFLASLSCQISCRDSGITSLNEITIDVPNLISPHDEEFFVTDSTKLKWSIVSRASRYRVQMSLSENFSSIIFDTIVPGSSTSYSCYKASAKFFWRVFALDTIRTSRTSAVWSFVTSAIFPKINSEFSMTSASTDSASFVPGGGGDPIFTFRPIDTNFAYQGRKGITRFSANRDIGTPGFLIQYFNNGDITINLDGDWVDLPFSTEVPYSRITVDSQQGDAHYTQLVNTSFLAHDTATIWHQLLEIKRAHVEKLVTITPSGSPPLRTRILLDYSFSTKIGFFTRIRSHVENFDRQDVLVLTYFRP